MLRDSWPTLKQDTLKPDSVIFFQLNLREQAVAQAELKRWQADFDHQVALANYYGVSMNLESLGIETGMPE